MIQVHDLRHVDPDVSGAWLREIAANLRQSDRDEVQATSGLDPAEALLTSYGLSSHAYAIISERPEGCRPVGAFGAAPHPLPGVGVVWMLGTDGIRREAYSIAKQTRQYLDEMQAAYLMLWNYIDARNAVSMRWLRWGGFKVLADHPHFGPEGRLFHTFARTSFNV